MRPSHRNRPAARLLTVVTVAVAALGLALSAPATAAFASDPVELSGRYVVDDAGVLGGDEGVVQDAIDTLATDQGINLFVVYTDSFTNPSDRQEWANEVATINQFGTNDVLLAVAVDDRLYQLSVDSGFALSDAQLAAIESDDIVPALRDSDWAGAAVGAAEGLGAALGGDAGSGGSGTGGEQTGGGFGGLVWVLAVLIIVVVGALVVVLVIRRRRSLDRSVTATAEAAGPTQKELDQRVGAVLVDLDDAVTTSQEELGFAQAQFGTEETAPFAEVLTRVKASLSEAFTLKQKLDDAVPDTAEERRAWSEQIIAICDKAADELDDQTEAFDALRALEQNPAPVLDATRSELAALTTAQAQAREALTALSRDYDAAALTTVSGSVTQAEQLRVFADTKLGEAATALSTGATADAAVDIRSAQQAVAQAKSLSAAVPTLQNELAQAATGLGQAVSDAQADLAEVARLEAAGTPLAAGVSPLVTALSVEVQRAQTVGTRDPLNARAALERANAPLDSALAAVRTENDRVTRLVAARDRAIGTAQSEIAAAQNYLQTRRGAVGPDARTRLSEAQRHLERAIALAPTDAETSLGEANSAARMAQLASSSASQDVSWAQNGGSNAGSGGYAGGDDFSGAMLGGLLGSLFGGGGGGGRSSSYGGWGGGSRGGSSWGGSRSSSRSSGGSRRSSGGSFGGGGRRGGGGRF